MVASLERAYDTAALLVSKHHALLYSASSCKHIPWSLSVRTTKGGPSSHSPCRDASEGLTLSTFRPQLVTTPHISLFIAVRVRVLYCEPHHRNVVALLARTQIYSCLSPI
jgi:hypothetical protein